MRLKRVFQAVTLVILAVCVAGLLYKVYAETLGCENVPSCDPYYEDAVFSVCPRRIIMGAVVLGVVF